MIKTRLKLGLFFLAAFFILYVSSSSDCVLDFTGHPYQPSGECVGKQEELRYLDSIDTTLCCKNVLNQITKLLANYTLATRTGIFLPQDQWTECIGGLPRESSVSADLCGFGNLYNGSGLCSSFTWPMIQQQQYYKDAVNACSHFDASYDDACNDCTSAILVARDHHMEELGLLEADDGTAALCGIAVVVSIAAEKLNSSLSLDDFYTCLSALEKFDVGYVKLKYFIVYEPLVTDFNNGDSTARTLGAFLLALIIVILLIFLIKYVTRKRMIKKKRKPPKPLIRCKEIERCSGIYIFSKVEIDNAINYGNEVKSLGRGSAGQVYRGILPSGQVVAIKHIHKSNTSDSFVREVDNLSRVRHPNLVSLFGCCMENGERYLVYEYCSSGNLAENLKMNSLLTWERRVKILRDCAQGLRYLHHYIDGCIVHRDIKLTNILLTENLDPKLSDFGLAKMLGMEETKVFTEVRGTMGYMDPEYMTNAKLTCMSDMYSFGIVCLQLLSGQKVFELDLEARDQLTRKAKDVDGGKRPLSDFEDPRLNGKVNTADFQAILKIAVLCVAKKSEGRPSIDDVFGVVEKAWKNTITYTKSIQETSSQMSKSMEFLSV